MNNKKRFALFLEFINKNKKIIAIALIASALFYWFAWRPTHIRKVCATQATEKGSFVGSELWQMRYLGCLKINGLKE